MRFADVVELPVNGALEQREERLDRVGMVKAARPNVLVSRMVNGAVSRKLSAQPCVDQRLVRHQVRFPANLRDDRFAQSLSRDFSNMPGTSFSITLHDG